MDDLQPLLPPDPDDYDGERFFRGLMWALGISGAMLALAWGIIHLIGR